MRIICLTVCMSVWRSVLKSARSIMSIIESCILVYDLYIIYIAMCLL